MLNESQLIPLVDELLIQTYTLEGRENVDVSVFLDEFLGLNLADSAKWVIIKKLQETGLFTLNYTGEGYPTKLITISDEGISLRYSHRTYENYINEINVEKNKQMVEEEASKRLEKKNKVSTILNNYFAIFFGILSIVLGVIAIMQQSHLDQIDNKVQEQSVKMDSILRTIQNSQKPK